VIPIDGERPRRSPADRAAPKASTRRRTSTAADAVAAGASRASGERARRRQASPLIDQSAIAAAEPPSAQPARPAPPRSPDVVEQPSAASIPRHQNAELERKVAGALAFVRRRITGEAEVDDFGFDAELTDQVLLTLLRPLYEHYFRVEVRGLENVPSEGGALVVANHSGTIPLDSVMTQIALRDRHPARRHLRMLGADLVFKTPFVGELARKTGTTLACNADAERLLSRGELVGVWPEGFKGIGKPFSERYKLQRFGRGGFVSAALRSQVPIVPCSIVGAEEIYPILGNMKTLARLLGLPYLPVTPTFPLLGPLGMIPLPSKWIIEFGEPIDTGTHGTAAADDPMLVFNLTDQVRETIQHTLYRLLMARRSVFF
jgi:1-acyl-sn-glycerol-3-phosphate acyltransferase